jgi:hypothetical protein
LLNNAGSLIGVPVDYVSGAMLSDNDTWSSTTLSDLGLTPGTYVYTWGNSDSVTVNVSDGAPEPGSVFLLGIGGVALLLYCSRKRIVHN